MRLGTLTFDQAYAIQREAEALISGREYEMDSYDVLALVHQSDCSAYDCEFVALTVHLGIRLVTMDKMVLPGFPGEAVALDGAGV